jgi:hypothetical protein
MCLHCEIENTLIDMHAQDYVAATLDDVTLSTGQVESLLGTDDFDRVMWSVTARGRAAVDLNII